MPPATIEPDVRRTKRTSTTTSDYAEWDYAGYYVADFVSLINDELDRLAALPRNWDREGASRIDPAIIQAARTFIGRLPENIASIPAVVPMSKGNLQFEWSEGQRSLELELETPTAIRYLKWHPEDGIEEEESFNIEDTDQAAALLRWVMEGLGDV
jgi:hypothetical protein